MPAHPDHTRPGPHNAGGEDQIHARGNGAIPLRVHLWTVSITKVKQIFNREGEGRRSQLQDFHGSRFQRESREVPCEGEEIVGGFQTGSPPPLLVSMLLCSCEAWKSSNAVSESSKKSGRSMNRKGKGVFVGVSRVSRTEQ